VSELYGRVVEAAYPHVKRLVRRRGVFLLAPPGSSRGYILERLLREGAVDRAYAYSRLAEELRARGLAVGDLPSAEELERGADRRVVVAVESSLQAVELKEKLGKRAKLIYLPKYFKKAAKDVDKKLLRVAEVEHRGLGEGISPKLLRPGEAVELKKGRDALFALSPGAVGFRDVAREALGGLRFKIASAFLAELLSPAFAVLAVLQAAAPSAAGPLLAFLEKAVEAGGEALGDFAARLLELFAGRREPRDKVAAGFAKLVRRALEAEPYIDDDRYEAVVDQVALEWGIDVKTFKALVKNLAALAKDKAAGLDLERLEEVVKREVEGVFKKVEDALREVKTRVSGLLAGVKVAFVGDVEAGLLHHNFVVVGGVPRVKTRAAGGQGDVVVDVVTGGVFGWLAGEVLERLGRDGLVVLVGPHGVGKSTLAVYAAWLALWRGAADAVVSAGEVKTGFASALENLQKNTGRRFLLLYDPVPVTAYYEPRAVGEEAEKEKERVGRAVEEALSAAGSGVKALVVLPEELYRGLPPEAKEALEKYVVKAVLDDVEFLHEVVRRYSGCGDSFKELAEKIAQLDGGYTLVAKYAGLWLRGNGCRVESVERAVEEAKSQPKLFLARYIRDVLLWRSSEEEGVRLMYRVTAPLLLHAVFGPVPEGVTYITQAKDGVVFYQPEEIEKFTKPQWDLLRAGLQPIAKWLAQPHEDLVEEVLRDLAGLNGEEARKQYKEALGDLIEALDWARGEVLKEGVPKERRGLWVALLAFVARRLAAVFKSGEGRRCWHRIAFIAGHVLAGYLVLPTTKPPEDDAEALGDALKPCAVDAYLTTDGVIPLLSIFVVELPYYVKAQYVKDLSQIRRIREKLGVLTPYVDADIIRDARKTAEELMKRWRGSINLYEAFYALGLAALVAEGEVDEKTADMLLHAASAAVQRVTHSAAVLPILAALRPLGEKAPHRYVSLLAAASELETLNQETEETVRYIYGALQQLKDRVLKAERLWPLVEAIRAYSNLLRKRSAHIRNHWKKAVEDMCELYSEVRERSAKAAPESGLSAQRLFDTIAKVYVLAAALHSNELAQHVQKYCGLGDLVREAEAVRNVLDVAAADPEELRKIKNEDFPEWVRTRNPADNARFAVEDLRGWFTHVLALYKRSHAIDEKGELDEKKLEETAEEFEKAAEISRKLKHWENYLTSCGLALRTRVLTAKSWEGFLKMAEGHQEPKTAKSFQALWEEAGKHLKLTAEYLKAATLTLSDYLVYLAVSSDKRGAEELLKEWRLSLDYVPEVSVNVRLMLKLFGVGEGARLEEVVDVFESLFLPEFQPALLMLTGRLQKDEALKRCEQLPKPEVCVNAVAAAAGDKEAVERLKSEIERKVPEASLLLGKVDGKTLVEVLASEYSSAHLAFVLLAAVEGRVDAVRLHGLWGSVAYGEPLARRLFRAVYEKCGDLNSEGCRLALLKLYYLQF